MSLTPCMDGPLPWTPPEDLLVDDQMFCAVRWKDAGRLQGWYGTAGCGSRLFYGFYGVAKIIIRCRMDEPHMKNQIEGVHEHRDLAYDTGGP